MIDLNNDLTLTLEEVQFDIPKKRVAISFQLKPTVGTLVQSEATQPDQFRVFWIILEASVNPEHMTAVMQLKDLNVAGVKQWARDQYLAWVAETDENQINWEVQQRVLFEYVRSIGVKT